MFKISTEQLFWVSSNRPVQPTTCDELFEFMRPFILTKEIVEMDNLLNATKALSLVAPPQHTPPLTPRQLFPESPEPPTPPTELHISPILPPPLPSAVSIVLSPPPVPEEIISSIIPHNTTQSITPYAIPRSFMKSTVYKTNPDPLFWALYIATHGMDEYQFTAHRHANVILEEKQKLVNHMKNNDVTVKPFMKKHKITGVSMKEMLSGILSNEPVNFQTIPLFCFFHNIQIYFIHKGTPKIWFAVGNENDTMEQSYCFEFQTCHHTLSAHKYKYDLLEPSNLSAKKRDEFKETHYKLESIVKPIDTISKYKVEELKEIAEKVGVIIPDKIKKNELYLLLKTRLTF